MIINTFKKAMMIGTSYCINYWKFKNHKVSYLSFPHTRGVLLISSPKGTISLGERVTINSGRKRNPVGLGIQTSLVTIGSGTITIGNNVGMSNVSIVSRKSIVIQDDVTIGSGVCIWDTDFHSLSYKNRIINHDDSIIDKPVLIKKGAFIGAGTLILKGVTIGENSIVGAGSVVTKSIPDHQIWGGNPATFIKNTED